MPRRAPPRERVSIRVPVDLLKRIDGLGIKHDRTRSFVILMILRERLTPKKTPEP